MIHLAYKYKRIANLIGLLLFSVFFATTINTVKDMWHQYAPINNFITIEEVTLVDSIGEMQIGYVTRKNGSDLEADYHHKYFCLNKNGIYVTSAVWQVKNNDVILHSTDGELIRIDIQFPFPDTVEGNCYTESEVYVDVFGYRRYYGQFTNHFTIER